MNRGRLVLAGSAVIAVLAMALAIGWSAPGRPTPPLSVTRYPRVSESQPLGRPNEDMEASVAALRDDLGPDVAAGGAHAPSHPRYVRLQRPPAPPPVDVVLVFRRRVAAVVNLDGQGLAILLANPGGDESGPRLLKVGDLFDSRWRIAALSMDEVVLQDGAAKKRVPLFGGLDGLGAGAQ
jgi:hypothetical protein